LCIISIKSLFVYPLELNSSEMLKKKRLRQPGKAAATAVARRGHSRIMP
jgi:hypothetical protein